LAWNGCRAEAEQIAVMAMTFLRACGLDGGRPCGEAVHESPEGPVVVPAAAAGYGLDRPAQEEVVALPPVVEWGIALRPRRAVAVLSEVFAPDEGSRPRAVGVWGPPGAGKSTIALELARIARLHGFVPIAVRLIGREVPSDLLAARTLFLIDDESAGGWEAMLDASRRSARAHVLLLTARHRSAGVDGVAPDSMLAA